MTEKWFNCDISELRISDTPEPDWSRVPEEKREMIKSQWMKKNAKAYLERVNLWGPQIDFFKSNGYQVTVLGDAVYPEPVGDAE